MERKTPRQAAAGQRREEGRHGVEPGPGGGSEVEQPSRMTGQPFQDFGRLVGGDIIEQRRE